jgi:hypothetical protein
VQLTNCPFTLLAYRSHQGSYVYVQHDSVPISGIQIHIQSALGSRYLGQRTAKMCAQEDSNLSTTGHHRLALIHERGGVGAFTNACQVTKDYSYPLNSWLLAFRVLYTSHSTSQATCNFMNPIVQLHQENPHPQRLGYYRWSRRWSTISWIPWNLLY